MPLFEFRGLHFSQKVCDKAKKIGLRGPDVARGLYFARGPYVAHGPYVARGPDVAPSCFRLNYDVIFCEGIMEKTSAKRLAKAVATFYRIVVRSCERPMFSTFVLTQIC